MRLNSVVLLTLLVSCAESSAGLNENNLKVSSLKDKYAAIFPIGTAGSAARLESTETLVSQHFNRLTAEYEMKWGHLNPQPGVYDFSHADRLIQFADQHGMKVTGHTFVWHLDTPAWLFKDDKGGDVSRTVLAQRMQSFISTVGQRFRGKVDSWDVVNEALADDSAVYRASPYYRIYGNEEYIADAFRFAAAADPKAELWYNDYTLEAPAKLEKLIQLIRFLKARNIKLTGIGFQSHTSLYWPSPALFEAAFQRVIAEGLKIKISELDMSIYSDYPNGVFTPEAAKPCDSNILQLQARRYGELFQLFRKYKAHISHVTLWGVADDSTWLDTMVSGRKDCPLLFDTAFRPKPAFDAIMNF